MIIGVVDIGSNSMRLLVVEGDVEAGRWVEVTGLGRGVGETGMLSEEAIDRTLGALAGFAETMDRHHVDVRHAMATSASRDAANRDQFFDRVEAVLGVRPELVSGEREGALAYRGATADFDLEPPVVVSDIGGGSTELVRSGGGVSIDMGSVRLTDRFPERPLAGSALEEARAVAREAFVGSSPGPVSSHIGVAGTWTSLAALVQELPGYERSEVHGYLLDSERLGELARHLCRLTLDETRALPSLDPLRAPVIAAGALVAVAVAEELSVAATLVSEKDTLDGAAMEIRERYID